MLQQEQGAPAGTAQGIPGLGQGKGGGAEAPAQPGLRRPDGPGVEQMAGESSSRTPRSFRRRQARRASLIRPAKRGSTRAQGGGSRPYPR
ncbi:MAG: hypothetical protein ACLVDP_07655 [Flavonifractor plautii]